jgi:hypothetical protein
MVLVVGSNVQSENVRTSTPKKQYSKKPILHQSIWEGGTSLHI